MTKSKHGFHSDFYESYIDHTLIEMQNCKVDVNQQAIAHAIMLAGAFIAHAIDSNLGECASGTIDDGKNLLDAVYDIGRGLNEISEKME